MTATPPADPESAGVPSCPDRAILRTKATNRGIRHRTLKLLQVMVEKGLVRRDDSQRSHVFKPTQSQERVQRQLLRKLLDGAFDGSMRKLVLQALSVKKASRGDLEEIRCLIEEFEGESP